MQTWQVGEITIHCVVETVFKLPYNNKSFLLPGATPDELAKISWLKPHYLSEQGHLLMAIQALLIEAGDIKLLVDTCIGNDKPRRLTAGQALHTDFLDRLAHIGWQRHNVTHVVCTHLHVDHVGWNTLLEEGNWVPTFPNAEYLIGKQEYEFWSRSKSTDQQAVMEDSVTPIFNAGLVTLVEMNHTIGPGLQLIPTPGHTPGHVSVSIQSNGEKALITGDFIHHPCQIARPDWHCQFDEDIEAASSTRKRTLQTLADEDTLVIGTHFSKPAAGRVRLDDNNTWYLETDN
ncbi:MBL fold metallo-hydrolase [Aurantivibrio plasticivorans]